jgi:hypothetical protein
MFALVGNHLFKDRDARLVAKLFDLLTILGDIASFIDLQPAKRQVCFTDAVRQPVGLPIRVPAKLWLCSTKFLNAAYPKIGVMLLSHRQTAQRIPAMRVRFSFSESSVGVEAIHFRLPVRFQSSEDLFGVGSCHAILRARLGISASACLFQQTEYAWAFSYSGPPRWTLRSGSISYPTPLSGRVF